MEKYNPNVVKIINGEYEGCIGTIDRMYSENDVFKYDIIISRDKRISYASLIKVTVDVDDTIEYDYEYELENQNDKTLCKNSLVRVTGGPYEGDVGLLVDILENDVCIVMTDIKSKINNEKGAKHTGYELFGTQKFIEKDFIECIDQNNNLLRDIRLSVNQLKSLSELMGVSIITAQQQPSFDITKYLTEDMMAEISRKAFTDKINDKVDEILKNRAEAGLSVVDQVIVETCRKYTAKLSDKFEEDFLKVAREEIQRENIPEGWNEYDIFRYSISNHLGHVVETYIDNNRDKIEELMKDQIEEAAKNISVDTITNILKRKINIEDIIRESLKDNNQ